MEHTAGHPWLHSTAIVALLVGAVGIAVAPICVRLSEVGPVSSAFWRVVLATPILFLLLRVRSRGTGVPAAAKPLPTATVIALGFAFAADLSLWHWSIGLTTVANSTLLCNLAAVFVTIVAWLSRRERITAVFLIGLGIGSSVGAMLTRSGIKARSALAWCQILCVGAVALSAYTVECMGTRSETGLPCSRRRTILLGLLVSRRMERTSRSSRMRAATV
jgi:drug/metabolite transporter (DMT)-like permease